MRFTSDTSFNHVYFSYLSFLCSRWWLQRHDADLVRNKRNLGLRLHFWDLGSRGRSGSEGQHLNLFWREFDDDQLCRERGRQIWMWGRFWTVPLQGEARLFPSGFVILCLRCCHRKVFYQAAWSPPLCRDTLPHLGDEWWRELKLGFFWSDSEDFFEQLGPGRQLARQSRPILASSEESEQCKACVCYLRWE